MKFVNDFEELTMTGPANTPSSDKVTLYYNPMSRGRIVHWMLEELEAPYELKLLDYAKKEHKSPEYLKINPMGKIPTLVHRGVVVTEAPAILAYLADAFPQAGMAPAISSPERGPYYRWLFFAASCVEYALFDRVHPRAKAADAGHIGYGTYEDTVNTLEQAVANGFILGKFSAVDVFIASQIGWTMRSGALEARPAFEKYLKLCTDRPAYRRIN